MNTHDDMKKWRTNIEEGGARKHQPSGSTVTLAQLNRAYRDLQEMALRHADELEAAVSALSPQPPTSEQFQTSLADVWEASAASLEEIMPHHEASMIDARRLRACARDLRWRESQVGSPQPPSEARKEEQ